VVVQIINVKGVAVDRMALGGGDAITDGGGNSAIRPVEKKFFARLASFELAY
jgi:hypothetical protein